MILLFPKMKKVISLLFATLFFLSSLISGQGISELNKISALVEHYKHHQEEHNGAELSFANFLWMHYDENSNHKNEENHDGLPLFHHCTSIVFFINETSSSISFKEEFDIISFNRHLTNLYEYNNCHSIFQPPKFS